MLAFIVPFYSHSISGMTTAHFHIQIPSCPDNINRVEPFVAQIKEYRMFNDVKYYDILLVLTEAVSNAIFHGNCTDIQKYVEIDLRILPNQLEFTVTDQGGGFNPATLPDPTQASRRTQPNGRGVYLMRQLADELQFADNGRSVRIRFNV